MKKLVQIILVLSCLVMAGIGRMQEVRAAEGSVALSVSSSSVTVGQSVTVTVSVSCSSGIGGTLMYLHYNSGYLSLESSDAGTNFNSGNGAIMMEATADTSESYSFTFSTIAVGSATVRLNVQQFIDFNGEDASGFAADQSRTITINQIPQPGGGGTSGGGSSQNPSTPAVTLSSDTSLASLSVAGADLLPEFSGDNTEYKVYLPKGTTQLAISAAASSQKASVQGGTYDLQPGWNDIALTCTAENGDTRTYNVHAYVEEEPTVHYQLDKQTLGVVKNLDQLTIPEGWEAAQFEKDGETIIRYDRGAYSVLYLEDEQGQKAFYLYDPQQDQIQGLYQEVAIGGKAYVYRGVPEKPDVSRPDQFRASSITIDEVVMDCWVYQDNTMADFKLLYLGDENGTFRYYRYDRMEQTVQRYGEPAEQQNLDPYLYLSAGAAGGAALLFAIILTVKSGRRRSDTISQKNSDH